MTSKDEPDSPVPSERHGRQPEPLDADEGEPDIEAFGPGGRPGDGEDDGQDDGSLGGTAPGSSGR